MAHLGYSGIVPSGLDTGLWRGYSCLMEAALDWRFRGKCTLLSAKAYDKLFFPEHGRTIKKAQQFCLGCPVKEQCLEWALERDEKGIWAGTNEEERKGIKRARRLSVSTGKQIVKRTFKKAS